MKITQLELITEPQKEKFRVNDQPTAVFLLEKESFLFNKF